MHADKWIFGYGSLIWNPGFNYIKKYPAVIQGWVRRFWQGSTDHRGVPEAPGRVVTLELQEHGVCWGMAYKVASADVENVINSLNIREQGGYSLKKLKLLKSVKSKNGVIGMIYIGKPDNPNYLGPEKSEKIAEQVINARGASGPNAQYVYRLADALRNIGAEDPHVFEIERMVKDIEKA
ncbi:MAG: gamma-glutamylcyclotransferase [Rhodospirillaceae bacterium]|nr:gamma-glutamylcyclotransferase [Rhodospirillaceae bacterium]|tara:strand:+ start:1650 stop:2189 length:540 start_codon:yes stop_codon:yes gene_type:complete